MNISPVIHAITEFITGAGVVWSLFYGLWYLFYLHQALLLKIRINLNIPDMDFFNQPQHEISEYRDYIYTNLTPPSPDFTCAVCFDSDVKLPIIKLNKCAHEFHSECVLEWLDTHASCPMCRQ